MSLACTITPNSINLLIKGRMRTIDKTHTNYSTILSKVKEYQTEAYPAHKAAILDTIGELVDIPAFVARVTEGRVQICDNAVLFDGEQTHGVVVTRILALLADGFDVRPMARFLEKLNENPNEDTRRDLYEWLERSSLPLCDDGDFLAFKKVRDDYRSYHGDGVDHSIGAKPSEPGADTDRYRTCSHGLHFCSYEYLSEYYGNQGRVVIVKINPKDVAAIPYDYNLSKGRAFTYEVVDEVPEAECKHFFQKSVVSYGSSWAESDEETEDDSELPAGYDEHEGDDDDDGEPSIVISQHIALPAENTEPVIVGIDLAAPPPPSKFEHNGAYITAAKLEKTVEKHGQRGASKMLGVPRSTLQGWLKKIWSS